MKPYWEKHEMKTGWIAISKKRKEEKLQKQWDLGKDEVTAEDSNDKLFLNKMEWGKPPGTWRQRMEN
jgi:hypothetical protein